MKVYTHYDEEGRAVFRYIRLSELPQDVRKQFLNWMNNRTTQIIDHAGIQISDGVYFADYERFIESILD